ncbi:MAG: tungsten-containing formylmethanofuran dehydrogenase subunit B [Alphaproteobacteria bacterium]|nr:MAG: tungsten-containing formylmethanofuran dehydrogenase subunit B [Alphaproteobacteria bacterium]
MADAAEGRLRRDVACPFCGLVCDDLTVENADGRLSVVEAGCWLSRQGYDASEIARSAMVDGRRVARQEAVARAAEILEGAQAPAFVVAADVAGARAALRLADRLGGIVDHPDSAALFRNQRVLQEAGALGTTLSEVRNRADLVLIVGPDPSSRLPRFFERCIDNEETLFGSTPPERRLFRLGPAEAEPGARRDVAELVCAMDRLPAAIAALSETARGGRAVSAEATGVAQDRLADLAHRLKSARYAVIVWMPAAFDMPGAEAVAQVLLELAREVTRVTRCSVLPLGGGGNLFGVNQVCTWQSGYPVRTGFAQGVPEHDPYRFSARRMIEAGEADAVVWISAIGAAPPPARPDMPLVLLAPQPVEHASVYIPVGMPGLDHAGQVFRTDNVVALRLPALRDPAAPAAATVLSEIEAELGRGTGK